MSINLDMKVSETINRDKCFGITAKPKWMNINSNINFMVSNYALIALSSPNANFNFSHSNVIVLPPTLSNNLTLTDSLHSNTAYKYLKSLQ